MDYSVSKGYLDSGLYIMQTSSPIWKTRFIACSNESLHIFSFRRHLDSLFFANTFPFNASDVIFVYHIGNVLMFNTSKILNYNKLIYLGNEYFFYFLLLVRIPFLFLPSYSLPPPPPPPPPLSPRFLCALLRSDPPRNDKHRKNKWHTQMLILRRKSYSTDS